MTAPDSLYQLVEKFERDQSQFQQPDYNEAQLRQEFVNPFFAALGWEVGDSKQVLHEAGLRSGGSVKHPDYSFLAGSRRAFYVETKKPSINIGNAIEPAEQLRSYGWSGDTALGILTNFAEFAIYDCRIEPKQGDSAAEARVMYLTHSQYLDEWERLRETLSPEAVRKGAHRDILETTAKGVLRVDEAFLRDMEVWRVDLAEHLHKQARFIHRQLNQRELNHLVQRTIDRIVFLRIAEDRNLESYGRLERAADSKGVYARIKQLYLAADERYNSGLFHFDPADKSRPDADTLSLEIYVVDNVLRRIINKLYPPESRYQFSVISADILGQVYERFLGKVIEVRSDDFETTVTVEEKPEVRKAGGVYYTPSYIVDYIVENTVGALLQEATPDEAAQLRVLDPACGSGSFLTGAYQYLLDWHLTQYRANPARWKNRVRHSADGIVLRTEEKKRILLNNIYGVDLDQNAVEVSKLSLLLKMLENESGAEELAEPLLPDLSGNIKWGNSLIGSAFFTPAELAMKEDEELYRVKPFDWASKAGFGEIMAAGGFDAVIGNPPYVRIQTMKETAPDSIPYYKKNYISASKGNYDIYVVFVEKGLQLLNERGLLGFILPHKFFNAKYGEPLRGLIGSGQHLHSIVHFGHQQIFEGATTYTCLLFLNKSRQDYFEYVEVNDLTNWRMNQSGSAGKVSFKQAEKGNWNFIVGKAAKLFRRLDDDYSTLGDISSHIAQGIRTSANEIFVLDTASESETLINVKSNGMEQEIQIERGLTSKFLRGREIKSYSVNSSGKIVIIPYKSTNGKPEFIREEELSNSYPKLHGYLLQNRNQLENREKGRMRHEDWYAFIYPKNIEVMQSPKILTPDIASHASFALDEHGEFAFTSGYGIILKESVQENMKYILGLLNSRVLDFYLKQISTMLRGGYFRYFTQYLAQLPIRTIDFDNLDDIAMYDEMVKLVDKMLDLHRQLAGLSRVKREVIEAQIESTDREIDVLVYRLYGLSDDEVRVVEGG